MNIELRKIQYAAFASEETSCYSAQVWVDGVHVADVSNDGHGGCDHQRPAKGKVYADVEALNAKIKATYPPRDTGMILKGKPFITQPDLEDVCGQLLEEHLLTKEVKRVLNRTVAYVDPEKKAVFTYKKMTEPQKDQLIVALLAKKPTAKVLNRLPLPEAVKLYREFGTQR